MAKYDGLSAKELRTRLLDADKLEIELNKANRGLENKISELKEDLVKFIEQSEKVKESAEKIEDDLVKQIENLQVRVHALSHDLEYERARRISAENARFDLEQRLHGLSNTHVEVSAIREIMPGLHIDRNGDIA